MAKKEKKEFNFSTLTREDKYKLNQYVDQAYQASMKKKQFDDVIKDQKKYAEEEFGLSSKGFGVILKNRIDGDRYDEADQIQSFAEIEEELSDIGHKAKMQGLTEAPTNNE